MCAKFKIKVTICVGQLSVLGGESVGPETTQAWVQMMLHCLPIVRSLGLSFLFCNNRAN